MFKNKISKWEPNDCECKLCQDYLYKIGYVNLADGYSICYFRFDMVIAHPRNPFTYKLNGCCKPNEKISEWARVPGCASEGFYLFIYLFICFYLIYLFWTITYYLLLTYFIVFNRCK